MFPPPPGLFMTVNVVGTALTEASARSIVRAVLSLLPPGGDAATISTFFCGAQPCAKAAAAAAPRTTLRTVVRMVGFTGSLQIARQTIVFWIMPCSNHGLSLNTGREPPDR